MIARSLTRITAAGVLAVLAGCASNAPKPLYQWEGFTDQVYQHLRTPDGGDVQVQIAAMEGDLQKIRAKAGVVPPGYQAHLGYLYLSAGDGDKALACLQAESAAFPEFTPYLRFLLDKQGSKAKTAASTAP